MSASQLSMFEPDAAEAARLVDGYLRSAHRSAELAERFDLLCMPGLARAADREAGQAIEAAATLASYCDLLDLAGLQ